MLRNQKQIWFRRTIAVVTALVMGVTFIPLLGGFANAAEDPSADPDVTVTDVEDIDLGEVDPDELTEDGVLDELDVEGVYEENKDAPAAENAQPLQEPDQVQEEESESGDELLATLDEEPDTPKLGAASDSSGGITLTPNRSTGILTVTGTISAGSEKFTKLYVIDLIASQTVYTKTLSNVKSFTETINMGSFDIGAYGIYVDTNKTTAKYYDAAIAEIYDTPVNNASQVETYAKYLFYAPNRTYYRNDYDSGLYVDIKKVGAKSWTSYGPITSTRQIKGLKPSTKYQIRAYYGKIVTFGGKSYFINGRENNKFKTVTVKTGKKKLPIKKVTVKAVNVKKHVHKRYGPYTGLYLGKETWYTYRLKVTVKMKKKPGVKGIYINGKKVKGNKKTYSVKFAKTNTIFNGKHVVKRYKKWWKQDDTYKLPRKAKYKVLIYSYSNKTYKAYSPIQKRTKRIK